LLAHARALLVMSRPFEGPWNRRWSEPGATVVSEAAASGTPVISSENGCLAEITPHVGSVIPVSADLTSRMATDILNNLPSPSRVRAAAIREWGHVRIAAEYVAVYRSCLEGAQWS
jgi:hypothetical protein